MAIRTSLLLLAPLALVACNKAAPKADTAAIEQQLLQNEAKWNQAYAERDAEALASMYADDAALANPGDRLVKGAAGIREATKSFAEDPNLKVTFEANRVQVAASGDLAYTRGHYAITMTDPSTDRPDTSSGYYLTVWQKQADGSWKAVEDFITPGPAMPAAQSAKPIL